MSPHAHAEISGATLCNGQQVEMCMILWQTPHGAPADGGMWNLLEKHPVLSDRQPLQGERPLGISQLKMELIIKMCGCLDVEGLLLDKPLNGLLDIVGKERCQLTKRRLSQSG
jgi:hypothetical protein